MDRCHHRTKGSFLLQHQAEKEAPPKDGEALRATEIAAFEEVAYPFTPAAWQLASTGQNRMIQWHTDIPAYATR